MKKVYSVLLTFFFIQSWYCQELPPISNYTSKNYNAGLQNWMISQDEKSNMYFANNEGLLEFNGSKWVTSSMKNESIIRSVYALKNRIYTGTYMDFGYWKRNNHGKLIYTSISSKLKVKLIEDEQFWGITSIDDWVIFQSLQRIFIYNSITEKTQIIDVKESIFKVFKFSDQIYFQSQRAFYHFNNGIAKPIFTNEKLNNDKVVGLINKQGTILLLTEQNGFFIYDGKTCNKYLLGNNDYLNDIRIYSCLQLKNQNIAIGTISHGIFILNQNAEILYNITQKSGLNNNTVLSIYEDNQSNLWLGLDNGIDCLNLSSSIKKYSNLSGNLGTVYASILFNDFLYIGTNQGLFYKKYNSKEEFKMVNGTKGQVWSLFSYDNILFCGHDSGTFIISQNQSNHIYSKTGTWKFEPYKNKIIQGNYYGLSFLTKKNGNWIFEKTVKNYNYSTRFFEITKSDEIIMSHEYRGLYKLTFDRKADAIIKKTYYNYPKKGKHSSVVKFNNIIYYASRDGVYYLEEKQNKFRKSNLLSNLFSNQEYVTGKMVCNNSNYLWFFTKNYVHYVSSGSLFNDLNIKSIPISSNLTHAMPGYENIYELRKNEFLIGTINGYYILKNKENKNENYTINISSIVANSLEKEKFSVDISQKTILNHKQNNITFYFAVPEYDAFIASEYQYQLEGFQEKWTKWSSKSEASFQNLEPGVYKFKVKAKVSNIESENIATYTFEIKKPWYKSITAILIYIILSFLLIFAIHKKYQEYYKAKHKKIIAENNLLLELKDLENQREIMKVKTEQLEQDVDKKNKELAVSTINLIKKDELLKIIKEDLKKTSEINSSKSIKNVILNINKNVSEDDTWNIFKEAFDKADNGFIKKVKNAHPNLTPNDLRLCAYLRLNLSSKEIAPLLNISVRSVEIKRYRLRKKIELPHDKSLVEYILEI